MLCIIMCIRSDHNVHRLKQFGRSRQPHYHPILSEEECHANVVAHGTKPTDTQAPTVGERSTGNVVMCMQDVTVTGDMYVTLCQSHSEAEVGRL